MENNNRDHENEPRVVYADIIDLPHWEPKYHPRMSLLQRSAQFAPFAALTGYEDMVSEEARETGMQIEPGEEETELLNRSLQHLAERIESGETPLVRMVLFVPDRVKDGGEYITVTEQVRRIDPVRRSLVLLRKTGISGAYEEISFDRILSISGIT